MKKDKNKKTVSKGRKALKVDYTFNPKTRTVTFTNRREDGELIFIPKGYLKGLQVKTK